MNSWRQNYCFYTGAWENRAPFNLSSIGDAITAKARPSLLSQERVFKRWKGSVDCGRKGKPLD